MEETRAFHDLQALAARLGWRQLEDAKRGEVYLSERTIYRDTSTGAIVWRLTSDPAVDSNDYYDLPSWNADGSTICFLSWRAGRKTRWLMDANGSNIRPLPIPEGRRIGAGYWSVKYRDRFYYAFADEDGTHVMALNPFSGEEQELVRAEADLGQMMPPHPAEEHFLFGKRQDEPGETQEFNPEMLERASWIYVLSLTGEVQEIELERRWHRLRFTKGPDLRIFFNFDNPRTQWTVLPDGSERVQIPYTGSHPDWLFDGSEMTFYAEGSIWGVKHDGSSRREIIYLGSGGHGGPCLDMQNLVSDTHGGGEKALYPDSILYLSLDGSGVAQVLTHPHSSFYSHTQLWHPDHHSTHAHPVASPDGTKTIFNSDMLGEFSDVYQVVNRLPDPPRDLTVRVDGRSVVLNWREPERCRELAGYNVYRFDEGAEGWKQLSFRPQRGTGWRGPQRKENAYYVVTAVEHSGLESRPSNQVYQLGNELWDGYCRLTFEAEAGKATMPMRPYVDMVSASNLYYIGCADGQAGGSLRLQVRLPKSGPYNLWARLKGSGVMNVELDGNELGPMSCPGEGWSWVMLEAAQTLMSGDHDLTFRATTGGEAIDQVFLTDDTAYEPQGIMALDTTPPAVPKGVTTELASPNALCVRWEAVSAGDLDHYNVYRLDGPEAPCAQSSLVASPAEAEIVDWGLRPGTTYWYKVTSVDRWGNESAPSEAAEGALPAFEPVRVELEARKARRDKMRLVDVESVAIGRVLVPEVAAEASAEWRFSLRAEGRYAIWGLSTHRRDEPSTFEVYLDGEPLAEWQVWGRWGEWVWSPFGSKWTGSPETFHLARGHHSLKVVPKTPTASVAQVVITNDPTWNPMSGFRGRNIELP